MDYFKGLLDLLEIEREEDRRSYLKLTEASSAAERRTSGITWYPIAIRGSELGRGDYLTVELERTTHKDLSHQLRFGMPARLFSNHDPKSSSVEGMITWQSGDRLKLSLRTDELPDWADDGKLGIDLLFDDNSYEEMQQALRLGAALFEEKQEGRLARILTGAETPSFDSRMQPVELSGLNESQNRAVNRILSATELAIVHGPPGTGKTTTLVQAIKALIERDNEKLLVVAPSNTAVDLLTEKLSELGLNVLRVGNPARVSEHLMALTLDSRMDEHSSMKQVRRLKKQANEYRNMAHKYKRHFGKAEREQRRALFNEAHKILKDVANTEQYIMDDLISKAQVIAAVVIDEAGQALEPAAWIPILKGRKLVLAGDQYQLPPTIKSDDAARKGLSQTLLEKAAIFHPEAVVMLEEQYRMNEQIMGYSSGVFYKGLLKAHASVALRTLFPGDLPLAFIDTAGCGFDEKAEGTSTTNPEEAAFLFRHLSQLAITIAGRYTVGEFPTTAVISPYKEQVRLLKEQLEHGQELLSYGDKISVNTIDSFQGQERDIVYISLVRSNTKGAIGFLSDIRRMNVAMTRAKKKLVMVGDSATLSQHPFYADLISYAQDLGAYQSAWEFIGV